MNFIDIQTKSKDGRKVTLAVDKNNNVTLLGNLPHGTGIVIDQKLVDQLQQYLDNKTTK